MDNLWISPQPLIVASTSALRARMLRLAGLPVVAVDPDIDESKLRDESLMKGEGAAQVASKLAVAKAQSVSMRTAGAYVLGFDQTLEFEGECLAKPVSADELSSRLRRFSGKSHALHSGFALVCNGDICSQGVSSAVIRVRTLSDGFIASYIRSAGDAALSSVGGYQSEGLGVQLFEAVEGDLFTVMGLPVLHVLQTLRAQGLLSS